jgi:hypothetical protein
VEEVLVFTSSLDITPVCEKIMLAFPDTKIKLMEREGDMIPLGIDLGPLTGITFYMWAHENGILPYCQGWVLLTLDPPAWLQPVIEAFKYKEEANKLEQA